MPYINDVLESNRQAAASAAASPPVDPGSAMPSPAVSASNSRLTASRFRFSPDKVIACLRRSIVGQEAVLDDLDNLLRVIKADIADPRRPLSVMLMAGPTGVGKSGTVTLLSEALTGGTDGLCRIDMNTLAQEHYSAALTGAPPGYVGSKEGHTLFNLEAIEGSFSTPGMVLFDEIEKASPEVIRTLLNIMEDGQLRLTSGGQVIDFRNSIIFLTSNVGGRELLDRLSRQSRVPLLDKVLSSRSRSKSRKHVQQQLEAHFDPEFMNRIDRILLFDPIDPRHAQELVQTQLCHLNQRLNRKGWHITLSEEARDKIARNGFSTRYGARSLRRAVRQMVEVPLAHFLLDPDTLNTDLPPKGLRHAHGEWCSESIRFQEKTTV